MKIIVVGAGYVGLVTGACFAKKGHHVTIVEQDEKKIAALEKGSIPFYEPGLDQYVTEGLKKNLITFTNDLAKTLTEQHADVLFSCVGTPSLPSGDVDMSAVWKVMNTIGTHSKHNLVVVNKSTVPVGTARKATLLFEEILASRVAPITISVASNPEFLREGSALIDFMEADRVVLGVESEQARDLLFNLYLPFVKKIDLIIEMNFESAELTKYAANGMLATRISFMNELARLADVVHADIEQIKKGIGLDRRIGPAFLNAGLGYGGSCFPKDIDALIATGKEHKQEMTLMQQVKTVNEKQQEWFIKTIFDYYGNEISEKTIGLWGLSFKPNTDDIRCSPALKIIEKLAEEGVKIYCYDPAAMMHIKELYRDKVKFVKHRQDLLGQVDALVIVTEWQEFLETDLEALTFIKDRVVFDGRNCFDPTDMHFHNIEYFCVGRNMQTPHWSFNHTEEPETIRLKQR